MDTEKGVNKECDCMKGWGWCHNHTHMLGRLLVTVIAALLVFWCGYEFGRLSAFAYMGGYGHYGPAMMQGGYGGAW